MRKGTNDDYKGWPGSDRAFKRVSDEGERVWKQRLKTDCFREEYWNPTQYAIIADLDLEQESRHISMN